MPDAPDAPTAAELLAGLSAELADLDAAIRGHRFLDDLEAGRVDERRLRMLAGEQHAVISSDRRSFCQLAARFPEPPAGDFFLAMAEGEGEALRRLAILATALGMEPEDLLAHEPAPGAQAYPAYVCSLALAGSRADVSLAFLVNLEAWGANCARARDALVARCNLSSEAAGFFDFFASPTGIADSALAVADAGLLAGESPARARTAARLLASYELMFWDALADA
jgi:thiaminase